MKQKGIIYIILSALFFSIMAAFVKSVPQLPLSEKMFFRNFIGLIAVAVTLLKTKQSIKVNHKPLMFFRAAFGLTGVGLYYAALSKMPLANAVILNKLSPFFVVIFAGIFLKEIIGPKQRIALVLSIIGALLVIQPNLDFDLLPALLALGSALFAGAAYTVVRKLTSYDHPTIIVFYFCLISSIVLIPFMMIEGFIVPSLTQLISLLGIGISALLAQLFMTNAYQYAPASELSIYTYINIVFSSMWGLIIWGEFPNWIAILGASIIILAAFLNYLSKKQRQVKS